MGFSLNVVLIFKCVYIVCVCFNVISSLLALTLLQKVHAKLQPNRILTFAIGICQENQALKV